MDDAATANPNNFSQLLGKNETISDSRLAHNQVVSSICSGGFNAQENSKVITIIFYTYERLPYYNTLRDYNLITDDANIVTQRDFLILKLHQISLIALSKGNTMANRQRQKVRST